MLLLVHPLLTAGMVVMTPQLQQQQQPSLLRRSPPHRMPPSTIRLQLLDMEDDLKPRFSRSDDEGPKTSFTPDAAAAAATTGSAARPSTNELTANQQLLEEIRALQPAEVPPPPERQPVDLNGIEPVNLLIGAASYGVFATLAWLFTGASAEYFAEHPMDSAFYVVARLSGVARVVVVGMGALGTGVATIASVGQLALAVQVWLGIQKGELDPKKERIDPYGGRKAGDLERMLGLMQGNKDAGGSSTGGL